MAVLEADNKEPEPEPEPEPAPVEPAPEPEVWIPKQEGTNTRLPNFPGRKKYQWVDIV